MRLGKLRLSAFLIACLILCIILSACGGTQTTSQPSSNENVGTVNEQDGGSDQTGNAEVPEEYKNLTNPFSGDSEAISTGKRLFIANCAPCHGEAADGNGPTSAGLEPKPANLSDGEMLSGVSDAFLFWRISEGGSFEPFNSAMPSWKGTFGEDQIWQLVTYIRSLSN